MHTYQIKITLDDIEPPIWRRLTLPSSVTLDVLHVVLQVTMGWEDCHPHEYSAATGTGATIEKENIPLSSIISSEGDLLHYIYDLKDFWHHTIHLEKILPLAESYPKCTAGERACPPENCGGSAGYEQILHAMSHPDDADSEEVFEWVGEEFDPEYFQQKAINKLLADFDIAPQDDEPEAPEISATGSRVSLDTASSEPVPVQYDQEKIEEAVLALLSLTFHDDRGVTRAWKTFDWDVMNRLHERGFIQDPAGKFKSVVMTDKGVEQSKLLFEKLFAR